MLAILFLFLASRVALRGLRSIVTLAWGQASTARRMFKARLRSHMTYLVGRFLPTYPLTFCLPACLPRANGQVLRTKTPPKNLNSKRILDDKIQWMDEKTIDEWDENGMRNWDEKIDEEWDEKRDEVKWWFILGGWERLSWQMEQRDVKWHWSVFHIPKRLWNTSRFKCLHRIMYVL